MNTTEELIAEYIKGTLGRNIDTDQVARPTV